MAEYIEREAVMVVLDDAKYAVPSNDFQRGVNASVEVLTKEVKYLPTADVVPKSEVEKLELTLQGVMWSVDKWLDETDYDADPIKRAITMREKTLKIVENLKAEVAREIFEEIERICVGMQDYTDYAELKKKYQEGEPNV